MKEFEDDRNLADDTDLMDCDYADSGDFLDHEDYKAMGIDPVCPTEARPGSEAKVLMLSARYAAGVPLWHNYDCYDHGPRESELMGSVMPDPTPAPITFDVEE